MNRKMIEYLSDALDHYGFDVFNMSDEDIKQYEPMINDIYSKDARIKEAEAKVKELEARLQDVKEHLEDGCCIIDCYSQGTVDEFIEDALETLNGE